MKRDSLPYPVSETDGYKVPASLQDRDIWVLWDEETKVPLAPWQTGHMYPADWNHELPADDRPETDYEQAQSLLGIPPEIIHDSYPFPTDDDGAPQLPDTLTPTFLLPYIPPADKPTLMQVDFDDARDPETGETARVVMDIVKRLDSYTEVSTSGEGLHVFVHASLPDHLGRFIVSLGDGGPVGDGPDIELYDHGRFVGATWRHVAGTPDTVRDAQDVIDDIIEEYSTEEDRARKEKYLAGRDGGDLSALADGLRGDDGGGDRSPYYDLPLDRVLSGTQFDRYAKQEPNGTIVGPHPEHGPQHSSLEDCTNTAVHPKDGTWYCWVHGGKGGGLTMLGVMEGIVPCGRALDIYNDDSKLLEACIAARDAYPRLEEEKPPYSALVELAKELGLHMADRDEGILGRDGYRIARIAFQNVPRDEVC